MEEQIDILRGASNRRSFLRRGLAAAGAATAAVPLTKPSPMFSQDQDLAAGESLNSGDIAILRFLAAAEILETDLWIQYNELGGVQDSEVPGITGGNEAYRDALEQLDDDMPQYIHDNTEDEITHFQFINAYLVSKGADPVNLDQFRTLPSSKATGARQIGRLTNLMQLTVDTSWWTRYRARLKNPDLDPTFRFPQAVPSLNMGQHPAIPRSDADLSPSNHIQAIANTAAFHFAFIEQGGSSLYPSLAQRVNDPEVLRILLSIGPTETAHFQTWQETAGKAVSAPLAPLTDHVQPQLVFHDLNAPPFGGENFETSLVMPEPCPFLSRKFPVCSIIRPTNTIGAAMGAARALAKDGLFIGQSKQFFEALRGLAEQADAAQRSQ
jgi:Ferritin-like domain